MRVPLADTGAEESLILNTYFLTADAAQASNIDFRDT